MTDRPIMFSASMVRALQQGWKTQTRRFSTGPQGRVQPGDRMWVRETFALGKGYDGVPPTDVHVKDQPYIRRWYRADADFNAQSGRGKMRPAIHMPRAFSRITLLVKEARFEHLQDITNDDAQAEGIEPYAIYGGRAVSWKSVGGQFDGLTWTDPRQCFRDLWASINGEGSWDQNPRLVVITFNVVQANIDTLGDV